MGEKPIAVNDLTVLQGLYLEDSYLLGLTTHDGDLRIRALFVLTADHPEHSAPRPGEEHCYRQGELRFEAVQLLEQKDAGKFSILSDPDGVIDFGSIDIIAEENGVRVTTEFLDIVLRASRITLLLDEATHARS